MSFKLKPEVTADFTGPVQHWHVRFVDDDTGQTGEGHGSSFDEAYCEAVNKLVRGIVSASDAVDRSAKNP